MSRENTAVVLRALLAQMDPRHMRRRMLRERHALHAEQGTIRKSARSARTNLPARTAGSRERAAVDDAKLDARPAPEAALRRQIGYSNRTAARIVTPDSIPASGRSRKSRENRRSGKRALSESSSLATCRPGRINVGGKAEQWIQRHAVGECGVQPKRRRVFGQPSEPVSEAAASGGREHAMIQVGRAGRATCRPRAPTISAPRRRTR